MKQLSIIFFAFFFSTFVEAAFAQKYVIGEGDVLKITIYDHDDLAQTVRVNGDGTIMLALLGPVQVVNLSVTKITQKIASLYADGYLINPQVNVFIEEFRSGKATILGQISKPGLYELRHHTTLLELISTAGGLTDDAGNIATIKRKSGLSDAGKVDITIDLAELVEMGNTALNIPIEAGDILYIQKANMVYVSGEVKKPGVYKCLNGATVIKAITIAGGFTDKAAPSKIKVIRKSKGNEEVFEKVNMDLPVGSEDVIVVPESFF